MQGKSSSQGGDFFLFQSKILLEARKANRGNQILHILVIGAGGMVGVKLINRLCAEGAIAGKAIDRLTRHDVVIAPPPPPSSFPIETHASDL